MSHSQDSVHNCFTKEVWSAEKSEWCCDTMQLGCTFPASQSNVDEVKERIAELGAALDGLETCGTGTSVTSSTKAPEGCYMWNDVAWEGNDCSWGPIDTACGCQICKRCTTQPAPLPDPGPTPEMRFLFGTTRPGHTVDWITPGTSSHFVPYSCAYITGTPYDNPCLQNYRGNANGEGMGRVCYREYEGAFRKVFEVFLYYEDESKPWNNCEHWDAKVKEALGNVKNYKWLRNNTPDSWQLAMYEGFRTKDADANANACRKDPHSGKWSGSLPGLCNIASKASWPTPERTCSGMPKSGAWPYDFYDCSDKCGCPAVWTAVCMDDVCIYNNEVGPWYPPGPNAGGPLPI